MHERPELVCYVRTQLGPFPRRKADHILRALTETWAKALDQSGGNLTCRTSYEIRDLACYVKMEIGPVSVEQGEALRDLVGDTGQQLNDRIFAAIIEK